VGVGPLSFVVQLRDVQTIEESQHGRTCIQEEAKVALWVCQAQGARTKSACPVMPWAWDYKACKVSRSGFLFFLAASRQLAALAPLLLPPASTGDEQQLHEDQVMTGVQRDKLAQQHLFALFGRRNSSSHWRPAVSVVAKTMVSTAERIFTLYNGKYLGPDPVSGDSLRSSSNLAGAFVLSPG